MRARGRQPLAEYRKITDEIVKCVHILKQIGSYEQASYAIQDTPDVVQQHYGRFLPQDKAALAAKILNQVWEAA
ncbi:hypothetical protein [Rhizobium sp. RU36D]|uniref:hypothetical protein n=1 Tax=Rhizobium sp. RU36D TaxID=1907415 RepID=UPI0009D8C4D2|nr:hypothetical protein [Rhizobium sp. RU36D]SMD17890.1 hypothetical protein SAMN05880593_13345 [Rhizobium sp. RU36D]